MYFFGHVFDPLCWSLCHETVLVLTAVVYTAHTHLYTLLWELQTDSSSLSLSLSQSYVWNSTLTFKLLSQYVFTFWGPVLQTLALLFVVFCRFQVVLIHRISVFSTSSIYYNMLVCNQSLFTFSQRALLNTPESNSYRKSSQVFWF